MNRGMTILEVMIASLLLGILFIIAYAAFETTAMTAGAELPLRDSQMRLQHTLDQLAQEVRESSSKYLWTGVFTDTKMPDPLQSYLVFLTARDATPEKKPRTTNLQIQWQQAVIFAPYYNDTQKRGELRRYTLNPLPQSWISETAPTVTFSAGYITINGVQIPRSGGDLVLADLAQFITAETTRVSLSATVLAAGKTRTTYSTSVFARN